MASSLLQVVAGPGHDVMQSAEQATASQPNSLAKKMQHASVNW
jgi:hypothetical protein